jgi:competence protein ComEC
VSVSSGDSTWSLGVKPGAWAKVVTYFLEQAKAEEGRFVLWSPLLLITGIWTYFGLEREPASLLVLLMAAAAFGLFTIGRTSIVALSIACCLTGFLSAKLRADWIATPLVTAFATPVQVKGGIEAIDPQNKRRTVLTLSLDEALGIPQSQKPRRIRLTVPAPADDFRIGQRLSATASLMPLPRPVMPGGFDYARQLYFQSIGGSGFASNFKIDETKALPARLWSRRIFSDTRTAIGERIREAIPGPMGAIADAMITGERASIPADMTDSLQRSGLFHILSISGLHMTIVAGGAFWIVRALLALSPFLALHYPIKKAAAVVALITGLFYMLLADSGPATERSYIMVAIMFFAILVDRRAISTHNLAIAALLILLTTPEQALSASFQMSFMAVMGIAGLFEWWNRRATETEFTTIRRSRWLKKVGTVVVGALATSLAAGALSSIPAIYHFGRIAPYSVIANALALPLVSILVMPLALAGTLLASVGLEAIPFQAMGYALTWVMTVSDLVAGWDAPQQLPTPSMVTVMLFVTASAVLFLAASTLRWLAALPLALIILVPQNLNRPDLYVEDRARTVAVRGADGELVPVHSRKSRFAVQRWLQAEGDDAKIAEAAKRQAWSCIEAVCSATVSGAKIVYLDREAEGKSVCPSADVVVAAYPLRRTCKGRKLTLDRFDVWKLGAIAVSLGEQIKITTVAEKRGKRPWVAVPTPRIKSGLAD